SWGAHVPFQAVACHGATERAARAPERFHFRNRRARSHSAVAGPRRRAGRVAAAAQDRRSRQTIKTDDQDRRSRQTIKTDDQDRRSRQTIGTLIAWVGTSFGIASCQKPNANAIARCPRCAAQGRASLSPARRRRRHLETP